MQIIQKILGKKKIAGKVLPVSWFATYQRKKIENCNSVGAGAQNIGKVIGFWPNFDLNFNDILRAQKGKLYILKKVSLSTFNEIL